ncbi:FxSxx-COOH system tetratricopeptide repeat protein, partial [Frankia sp. AgPm24]|uniref:FxSxx-COOH system tetratricopeptide repeat protein n=1 Tax=Frankia sp. AgPm24 TaxID=631128 RepID=UPI00200E3146
MTVGGAVDDGYEWDFFVSYTAMDQPWAVWVAWVLEEAGFRVLVQAWDFQVGTNWVAKMDEGVSRARRTIAVLSEYYARSVYGKAEWQAAWVSDPLGADRRLLVFRVTDCPRPGLLGQVVSADLFGRTEQTARETALGAARAAAFGTRAKPTTAPAFPPNQRAIQERAVFPGDLPAVWNVPARLTRFVGRPDQLADLADYLLPRTASIAGAGAGAGAGGAAGRQTAMVAVVALAGMGGVGKTSLAIEYVHRHSSDFDVVWWVDAERPEAVTAQITELGEELHLPVGVEPAVVLAELRRRGYRWLLVFDNAEDPATVTPYRPADERGRVLVTSRRTRFRSLGATVEVPTLARSESVTLLSGRVDGLDDPTADQIAELLGDLALAVEQAAAYCEQTNIPAAEFIQLLAGRLEEVVEHLGEVMDRAGVTVATLWDLSVARLATIEPAAVELLELLAFCSPEPVPLDLFTNQAELLGDSTLAAAASDSLAWPRAVGALVSHGLATREKNAISVHRLIQAVTRRRTPAIREQAALATLLRLLQADLPGDIYQSPQNWPRWRDLLLHVLAVVDRTPDPRAMSPVPADDVPADIADLTWLCDRTATYLQERGRVSEALRLFERALAIGEAVYGPDHPEVAIRLNNQALALRDLGRVGEALRLFERALAIGEAVYGPDHPEVA